MGSGRQNVDLNRGSCWYIYWDCRKPQNLCF